MSEAFNTETTFPQFDNYACEGDRIEWTSEGFDFVARLEFYVGVVLSVSRNGVELSDHAASLWGVDCNFSDTSNAYLSEVAQELEAEALETARAEVARIRQALEV
jgi:hypothetical protein